jgi:hypothetical protein
MLPETRWLLDLSPQTQRFEHRERGDYDLDRFDQEFRERLYSEKGREILRAWEQREARPANGEDR